MIINFNKIFIYIFFLLTFFFSESLYEYIKRKRYNTVLKRKNQWKLDVKNSKDFKIIGKLESWNRRGDEERCAGRLRNLRFPGALCFYFLAETPTISFLTNHTEETLETDGKLLQQGATTATGVGSASLRFSSSRCPNQVSSIIPITASFIFLSHAFFPQLSYCDFRIQFHV